MRFDIQIACDYLMLERFSCYFAIRSSSDGSICGSNGCSSSGGSSSDAMVVVEVYRKT